MTPPTDCPAPLAEFFPEAEFIAEIGEGAYGEVWLGRFPGGAWRAVKFVAGDGERAERERRALRLLRSLADPAAPDAPLHPALMPVADLREGPGAFAYSMPVADSLRPNWRDDPAQYRPRTLAAELTGRRALPLGECLDLAEALGSGLAYLQRHCLVHRDLKPSNVLFLEGRPVLADFGLLADTREAESVVGTPAYVPKEQHGAFPADIYSLGVLLSVASTGRSAGEVGLAPVDESDRFHPLFPRWLDLLRRCTDSVPARRPQTAEGFLKELHALREAPARPRWGWRLLLAVLVFGAIAGAVVGIRHGHRPLPPAQVPAPVPVPAPASEPPAPVPPSDGQLYISRNMADDGAFLQLFTDRIRVGLPLHGFAAEDACLLLVLPPDDPAYDPAAGSHVVLLPRIGPPPYDPACDPDTCWNGPVPWRLCPLVPADASNTPPSVADAPAFPDGAPHLARTTHAAIAILPDDVPYPEAVFLLCEPVWAWEQRLAELPEATLEDLRDLWWNSCEHPRSERESLRDRIWMEQTITPLIGGETSPQSSHDPRSAELRRYGF